MYLIETSVWIDFFRNKNNQATTLFTKILDNKIPFGLTSLIYQEILQGADSLKDYNKLSEYLSTQKFFYPQDEIISYEAAAKLYFNCRRKGLTIKSTIDCLIAQIAIEHELTIVHNDNDYLTIKKANNELKLA